MRRGTSSTLRRPTRRASRYYYPLSDAIDSIHMHGISPHVLTPNPTQGVACVNSTFTAVTSGGNVLQSPNGYEWAIVTPGLGGNALWTVRSINNTFYAGGTGSIFTSDKGAKYIPHPLSQSTVYVFDLSGGTTRTKAPIKRPYSNHSTRRTA